MARNKIKLALIKNNAARKATYQKRKRGLIKKVRELSTLCDIKACAIIYSPYDAQPQMWPSSEGVHNVISEYKALPVENRNKKMVDHKAFLNQRIAKIEDQINKQAKENIELEMREVMSQYFKGNVDILQCLIRNVGYQQAVRNLNDLGYMLNQSTKQTNRRNEILGVSGMEINDESSNAQENHLQHLHHHHHHHHHHEVGSSSSLVAPSQTFFDPFQNPMMMAPPHVGGLYDQSQNQQQWGTQMMMNNNPNDHHMGYDGAEQTGLIQFMNDNHHHHDQPSQQQHVYGEPSTAAGSSGTVHGVTDQNPANNIWFR